MTEKHQRRPYWRDRLKTESQPVAKVDNPPPKDEEKKDSKPKQVRSRQRLPKKPDDSAFAPKNVATKDTHVKNDPLMVSSVLVEGLTVMAPNPSIRFTIDTSQYFTIIRDLYLVLTKDKDFKNRVSLSAFEYYAVILLWKRLLYVTSELDRDRTMSDNFVAALPSNLSLPEELGRYLDGIGNILDHNGRNAFLQLLNDLDEGRIRGLGGHYGPVDADTHTAYSTIPAPFVCAYRMCYEFGRYMSMTPRAPGVVPPPPDDDEEDEEDVEPEPAAPWPRIWDLPAGLAPGGGAIPNRNLLGWHQVTDITRDMAIDLDRYVIVNLEDQTFDVNVRHVANVPIFYDLLATISRLLSTTKKDATYNTYAPPQATFAGSQAVEGFVTRSRGDYGHNETGMNLTPLAQRVLQTESSYNMDPHLVSATTVFRYRIERYVDRSSDCFCYTTRRGGILAGWAETANDAFASQPRWNSPDFNGPLTSGRHASEKYLDGVRKIKRLDP